MPPPLPNISVREKSQIEPIFGQYSAILIDIQDQFRILTDYQTQEQA